jgi:hypothetical protein
VACDSCPLALLCFSELVTENDVAICDDCKRVITYDHTNGTNAVFACANPPQLERAIAAGRVHRRGDCEYIACHDCLRKSMNHLSDYWRRMHTGEEP